MELWVARTPKVQVSLFGHLPGVLRIQIDVEEVEGLGIGKRECRGRGGCDSVDELRQIRIGDGGDGALAEVEVVQPEDAGVGAETKLMRAVAPREIVVDEKSEARLP